VRYLALDIGDKRTGVALGDDETGIVSPLRVEAIDRRVMGEPRFIEALAAVVVKELGPAGPSAKVNGEVVIGLPLNMDGSEGPPAVRARTLAAEIAIRTGRIVHVFDERLTSAQADWSMAQSGLTHGQKKDRRDALAAATLLRDFLERR
jgi:putative holliday junction resolvase